MFTQSRKRKRSATRCRPRIERLESRNLFASDWCNPANPLDVDQSGRVAPLDVLQVINEINSAGSRALPAKPADYTGTLFDVNGDDHVSPLDVLSIINALNRYNMPMALTVPDPTGERTILPSGSVVTNIIYEGTTVPDSKVVLEQIAVAPSPMRFEAIADADGLFHFQFDTEGSAVSFRMTSTDKLGRVEQKTLTIAATNAAAPELLARIAAQSMPTVGDAAPAVSLQDQDGHTVNVGDYVGQKKVVLYFYPKDDTPGCTTEAQDFRDHLSEIEAAGAVVIGVSLDTVASHKEFSDKFHLNFPILADPSGDIVESYGVLSEYNAVPIAKRTTFIIGTDGKIEKIYENVHVIEHIQQVISHLTGA